MAAVFKVLVALSPALGGCRGDSSGPIPVVASLDVTPSSGTVEVGGTLQLTATPRDVQGNSLARTVAWTTSHPTVATVSPGGLVTAIAAGGPVSVTATAEGRSGSAAITVLPAAVASVSVTLPATLAVGERAQASAVLRDANGNRLTLRVVSWSSSDTTVATVAVGGLVTAIAPGGPVSITATVEGQSGSAAVTVILAPVASVSVTITAPTLTAGQETQAVAVLRDERGIELSDRMVTWQSSDPSVAAVSPTGRVTAVATGQATITASAEGVRGDALVSIITADELLAMAISTMLQQVPSRIAWAISYNEGSLARNPHLTSQIQAKIAMLQAPTLAADIVSDARYAGALVNSLSGGSVPIVAIFPLDTMRTGAVETVATLTQVLPLLESFFAVPIFGGRDGTIRVWYGFTMGYSGGGGTITSEDRGTYESRTNASRLPHHAIIGHELAHSYVGHESLTQYLELYAYNVIHTSSTDVASWIYTREYSPFMDTNTGVHALLDIHQLIGWHGMAGAYRRIYPMAPPYGVVLCDACKQAFVAEAPLEVRAQVATIIARVTY